MRNTKKSKITYELNEKPPIQHLIPLSLQQVLLFIASTIAVPLIIANGIGLDAEDTTLLVQCAFFCAGIGTMVQCFGIGRVGSKLPIVLGTTFTFISPCIAISLAYGLPAFIGASLIGGIAVAILGAISINAIKKLFPPMVMGCVILVIGVSLLYTAVDYMAGGSGTTDYGSWKNYIVAIITIAAAIVFNIFGKGFVKGASVLLAMVIGTIAALAFGMVDFSSVGSTTWFGLPKPFHFGIAFNLPAIIVVLLIYLVNTVEFLGDTSNCSLAAQGRVANEEELTRGILCDGLSSAVAAVFNTIPVVSFSGNIGLITLTGVKSRFVVGVAGIVITILSFFPKLAMVCSLIPAPVIGGATLIVFGIIAYSGIDILRREKVGDRDMLIVAVALAVGIGFNYCDAALANTPYYVSTLIKGIPGTAFTAIILNLILPKKTAQEKLLEMEKR